MSGFSNIDLLSVGVAVAANLILGFIVFFRDPRSSTSILFLIETVSLSLWSVLNYLSYEITTPETALLIVRLVMFSAGIQATAFFLLMSTFPSKKWVLSRSWTVATLAAGSFISVLALTPFLFSDVILVTGEAPQPIINIGIFPFAAMAVIFVIAGISSLIQKIRDKKTRNAPLVLLSIGVSIMFFLIIVFNLILPTTFQNTRFIPLSALFTIPFVAFTAYAIIKHNLFSIKVVAAEILTFLLAIAIFIEIIFADTLELVIFRSGIFLLVLSFGILLIRSIRNEVKQRLQLERLTKKLKTANTELEKLNKQKSEFLSFASHDLKAPVALMKQFATLIYDGTYNTKDKIKETAFKIKMTAESSLTMVENFLNIRRIEEGKMNYNFEKINVIEFVENLVDSFNLIAKQKGMKATFTSRRKKILVEADVDKIGQVFQNLLDNALKYTPEGSISVTATNEEKTVLFSFKDTGLGIKKSLLPTLFEQFHRAPGVVKTIRGTGLGLYIARQIIEKHKGEIWVESEGEGKGSTFFVRLRKAE